VPNANLVIMSVMFSPTLLKIVPKNTPFYFVKLDIYYAKDIHTSAFINSNNITDLQLNKP